MIPNKIPIPLGILVTLLIVGTVIGINEGVFQQSAGAAASQVPKNVEITNVSDAMFTVSWVTDTPATGAISVSSPKNTVYYDERDARASLFKYRSHAVTIRNAEPATTYAFAILSNGKKYTDDGKSYVIMTGDALSSNTNTLDPAYGSIRTNDGIPAEGALVYLTVEGGQKLSALTKSSGSWLVPLSLVRTGDLTSFLPLTERMEEEIIVRFEGAETTAVTDSLNDSPVPEMTLGKTYDFRKQQAKTAGNGGLALRPTPTSPASAVLGSQTSTNQSAFAVTLASPGDTAALATTLPLISGTGVPGKLITIVLGITDPIGGSTRVRADGTWSYTPPKKLAPGKQSVTISSTDARDRPVAITHLFQIFKSGTQVLGDATPSATLEPTLTETETPTPEESPVSTLAGVPPPTSGNELPTILLLLLAFGLLASGAVVVIK